jgi:hypothetical protein
MLIHNPERSNGKSSWKLSANVIARLLRSRTAEIWKLIMLQFLRLVFPLLSRSLEGMAAAAVVEEDRVIDTTQLELPHQHLGIVNPNPVKPLHLSEHRDKRHLLQHQAMANDHPCRPSKAARAFATSKMDKPVLPKEPALSKELNDPRSLVTKMGLTANKLVDPMARMFLLHACLLLSARSSL